MVGARKMLDRVFDKSELRILDDVLPESQRKEKLDDEDLMEELEVKLKGKNIISYSLDRKLSIKEPEWSKTTGAIFTFDTIFSLPQFIHTVAPEMRADIS